MEPPSTVAADTPASITKDIGRAGKTVGSGGAQQEIPPEPAASSPSKFRPNSLARALAAREALLRELESRSREIPPSVIPLAALALSEIRAPSPLAAAGREATPATAEDAAGAEIRRLEEERVRLTKLLAESRDEVERLRQACEERDRRIAILEANLHEIESMRAKLAEQEAVAAARISELEKKCRELMAENEQETRNHAHDVAALTKTISELRARYEPGSFGGHEDAYRGAQSTGADEQELSGSNGNRAGVESRGPIPADAPGAETEAPEGEGEGSHLVIIDDSEIGAQAEQQLGKFGYPARLLRASHGAALRAGAPRAACLALNLAAPATWRVVRTLRTTVADAETPILAYVLAPRTDTGYWFGDVDFVTLPLEYNDLVASLRRLAQPLKHVLLIGMDEKLVARVRKHLATANVSISVAQDRRGAIEAVRGKYPQAAVVYAAHNPVDGFRAVAGVRGLAIFKDLPTVFLLDPVAAEREEELLSAGARTLLRLGTLNMQRMVDSLVSALHKARPSSRSAG